MTNPLRLAIVLAALAAAPAAAQQGVAGVCGDPQARAAEAVRFCRRALEQGGLTQAERARAEANLGIALMELENPQRAVEAYQRATEADPGLAIGWSGLARAREALGEPPAAAVAWNRAVRAAPRDGDILTGRGAFRLRAGNAAGALEDFEAAARAKPGDPDILFNSGLALAALGRDAEAERAFTRVLRERPEDVGAWINRARLRISRDRAAALADYDAAVARAEGWSTPWFERAVLLDAMGRRDEADRDFRRAWELGHRNELLTERMLEMGR